MIHAQLDEHLICTGYSNLNNIELHPLLVYLPNGWNEDFLWRKWVNGEWSAEKFPPPPPVPQPDAQAQIEDLKAQLVQKDAEIANLNTSDVELWEAILGL